MTEEQEAHHASPEETVPDSARGVEDLVAGLDDVPVADHVARFTTVHDVLRSRLDGQENAGADGAGQEDTGAGT